MQFMRINISPALGIDVATLSYRDTNYTIPGINESQIYHRVPGPSDLVKTVILPGMIKVFIQIEMYLGIAEWTLQNRVPATK